MFLLRARIPLLAFTLSAALAPAAKPAAASRFPGPRPFSAAEQEAVRLAAEFLDRGPQALLDAMPPEAVLRKLPQEVALSEIEVRTGSPEGSEWRLTTAAATQEDRVIFAVEVPSGSEDFVVFRFDSLGGKPRLVDVLGTLDPLPKPASSPVAGPAGASTLVPLGLGSGAGAPVAAAFLAILFAASAPGRRRRRCAAGLGGLVLLACGQPGDVATPTATVEVQAPRLGDLLPLRRISIGEVDGDLGAALAAIPQASPLQTKAQLLDIQGRLGREDLAALEGRLATLPGAAELPLTHLLRSRMALERRDLGAVRQAYEGVLGAGLDCDLVRLRVVEEIHWLGDFYDSRPELERLMAGGTREALPYYLLARIAILDSLDEEQLDLFRSAWALSPIERHELFADPVFAFLATRREVMKTFELADPEEPLLEPPQLGEAALAWPSASELKISGSQLIASLGQARLVVPGGSPLATLDATVERADVERRRIEEKAMARVRWLEAEGRLGQAMQRPRERQQVLSASLALAREAEWGRLAEITQPLVGNLESVDPLLPSLRAVALERLERGSEARELLLSLALEDKAKERRRPEVYYQLADLYAAHGDLDTAIRLIERADKLSPLGPRQGRVAQLRLEKELLASSRRLETKHFDLVFPTTAADTYVHGIGSLLEGERQRLLKWIPLAPASQRRVEVHLYPARQFFLAYGGGIDIVGLYDGKVRVPFGNLPGLSDRLGSVLTHELAHAMISEATRNRAPKWLQEGLAQHVELYAEVANPLTDLEKNGTRLSFPVVQAVLQGFSEPRFVEIAYDEAAWILHFIETKHGVGAIRKLVVAFGDGLGTPEALARATGQSVVEFDRRFRTWGQGEGPLAWKPERDTAWKDEAVLAAARENVPAAPPPPAGPKMRVDPAKVAAISQEGEDEDVEEGGKKAVSDEVLLAWHRTYSARTAAIKTELGTVLEALKTGDREMLGDHCKTLRVAVRSLLVEKVPLEAPDPAVRLRLREAFFAFEEMAAACAAGHSAQVQVHLKIGERALRQVAAELDPYGVEP